MVQINQAMDNMLSEQVIVDETVAKFRQQLHSSLPLRHYTEYYEEAEMREKAIRLMESKENKAEALKKMLSMELTYLQIGILNNKIDEGNKKCLTEWVLKSAGHKARCEPMISNFSDLLCQQFRGLLDAELKFHPDMNLEALKNFIEERKNKAIDIFEDQWKNAVEQKENLRESLKACGEGTFGKHKKTIATLQPMVNGNSPNEKRGQREIEVIANQQEATAPKRPRVNQIPASDAASGSPTTKMHCVASLSSSGSTAEARHSDIATRLIPRTSKNTGFYGAPIRTTEACSPLRKAPTVHRLGNSEHLQTNRQLTGWQLAPHLQ